MSHLTNADPNAYVPSYEPSPWETIMGILFSTVGPLFTLAATVLAIVDCARRPVKRKTLWLVLIIVLPLAGPGLYFLFGRYKLQNPPDAEVDTAVPAESPPSATSWTIFRIIGSVVSAIMVAIGLVYIGLFLLIMLVLAQCELSGGGGSKGCY